MLERGSNSDETDSADFCSPSEMGVRQNRRYRLWLFPLVLGIGILLSSVARLFDLSMGGTNPYTEIELFAEMPQIDTLRAWAGIVFELLLLMTVVSTEFAYSKEDRFRPLESPGRLFAFVLIGLGAIVALLDHERFVEIMPDLAHYYYVREGTLQDIAAVSLTTVWLDTNGILYLLGTAFWVGLLCRDLLRERRIPVFWGVVGLVHAALSLFILLTQVTDAGYASWMSSSLSDFLVTPLFFIGLAFQLRRHMYAWLNPT